MCTYFDADSDRESHKGKIDLGENRRETSGLEEEQAAWERVRTTGYEE